MDEHIPSRYDEEPTTKSPAVNPPMTMPGNAPPYNYGPVYMPPRRRRRRRWSIACLGCGLALLSFVGIGLCGLVVFVAVVANSLNETFTARLAQVLPKQAEAFQTTHIYDRDGNELYQLFDQGRRTQIKLADISKSLIDATIAVEDNSFYENPGVDVGAIMRAGLQYFTSSEESGGASTITQQLVRNIAFDYAYRTERSAQRKIEEALLALVLTQQKSKDEILEMYLNTIYYGNLAYGIEAAAQTYFGKSARDLTLAEAALLAGLPQAPANLDPLNPDPQIQEAVLARRKVVLDLMVEKGKISRAESTASQAQTLVYANPNVNLRSPHFTLYAQDELKALLPAINLPPAYLTTAGLSVYTTLDPAYQALAERVANQQISAIKTAHNANNAAVVILQPGTGEILAMMGSVNYNDDSIDGRVNIAISPRQPGSAMKPLTYAAAMENGFSAASVLWDVETHINQPGTQPYSPVNYDGRFHGPVRVRDALANSYNIPAVETLRQIGVDTLLRFAERVGVRSLGRDASRYGLSLTLGGGELTPLELTQAYAVFADQGQFIPATSLLCVINGKGEIIYQYENGCAGKGQSTDHTINAAATGKAVLDPRIAFVISNILNDNAARTPAMGSNSPLRTDGIITSVKTGTTNDYRDNWTVGFTRNVAVGVWVGNTDNKAMQKTTGLTGAAPIWHDVITSIYSTPSLLETLKRDGQLRPDELTPPPGISKHQICSLSALTDPSADCAPGRSEWLLDTPPLIPDSNGNLTAADSGRFYPTQPPANGPRVEDVDPGVVRALVLPLDPAVAATLMTANNPQAMPPTYCLVPNEVADQVPGANRQVFIKAPGFSDEDVYARRYAQGAGLAIAPRDPCTTEMLSAPQVSGGAMARISSPHPGDTVTGTVYVTGTASWQPGQATSFKMEIQGPQFPNWTTFDNPSMTPVINGPLGNFGAAGLVPGVYQIRIVIVAPDSNFLLTSAPMPLNVTGQ